ncbi:MAG: Na+/H+ antiporter NhaC [Cellvibrionales bacterium]|tara:strand:+ start:7972 stop:9411 length:1440 start_codon:yes stop_codon:yes gene_type:complete
MNNTSASKISLFQALLPVGFLVVFLATNVFIYGDDALGGAHQFVLLMSAAIAGIIGSRLELSYQSMLDAVAHNIQSITTALLILLFVGSLAGTWLLSGIIPAMIYYGLQIIHPNIFLPACVILCALVSVMTGSSWSTTATVGIALIGIGKVLGIPVGMVAGAVISGAYFGDKLSPLSDTTNLAPAMAGTNLFVHIRYMTYTTVPTIVMTLMVFSIISMTQSVSGTTDVDALLTDIEDRFNISLWFFLVPATLIMLIVKKTPPLVALLIGTLLGALCAIIYQPNLVLEVSGASQLTLASAYQGVLNAMTTDIRIQTNNVLLNDLFTSGGMQGMLGTIWLVICAMVFGGVMDAIGALQRISRWLLTMARTQFQLIASAVASCITVNITVSDQYLAILLPGKMYRQPFSDQQLAPENLSRTLEDAGTVTSALVPWNTCGAYHSGVLGVGVGEYFIYAIFNWLSPIVTLVYAFLNIKIRQLIK